MAEALPVKVAVASARERVARIRAHLEDVKVLVVEAYRQRDWDTLGYESWAEYCADEFGGTIAIPREERGDVVFTLRDAGMSTRAIGSATGISHQTVGRQLSGGPDGPPADAQQRIAAAASTAAAEGDSSDTSVIGHIMGDGPFGTPASHQAPDTVTDEALTQPPVTAVQVRTIIGTDGKQYLPHRRPPDVRTQRPWPTAYAEAVLRVMTVAKTITSLADDKRAPKHRAAQLGLTNDLRRAVDALCAAIALLDPQEITEAPAHPAGASASSPLKGSTADAHAHAQEDEDGSKCT